MIRNVGWAAVLSVSLIGADIAPSPQQNATIFTYRKSSFIDAKIDTKADANLSLLGFEGMVKKKYDNHIFRAYTTAYHSSIEGAAVKNKWSSEVNYDYQLGERYSLNYMFGYKKTYWQNQVYTGPSIGVKMFDKETHRLDLRGNILFDKDKLEEQHLSGKVGAIYTWKAQDNLKFIQEGSYRVRLNEADNYIIYSKSAIESKITPKFSVGVSYKVDCINTPEVPSLNTNSTLSALLTLKY